ncbi:MAG: aspartate aminotransferase family protein [Bacillota bacterium]|nr:aspartate aminotransferase family protein [Bacillota bacterium]MDW7684782.1 aspartate aminotransferase family protein [Bacillota bacterium]
MESHVFYRAPVKQYPVVAKTEGIYIEDTEGKRYLDGASGCVVANIGYSVPQVAQAMKEQAQTVSYVHGSTFTSRPQEELARCIAESAPPDLDYVYFVSGGTEANETAISMALQYHMQQGNKNKWKIIGRTLSYHGSSLGTLAVASNVARRRMFSPLILPFPLVPAAHCYRCPLGLEYPGCSIQCAKILEQTILAEGPDNVAAFIVEPIIGTSTAAAVPPPEYFPMIRHICDKYNVLLIADEVMCGYGRAGTFTAMEQWQVRPDLFTLGKGLGGGYAPLAAVVAHQKVFEVFKNNWGKFIHGFTYQGNPVSCAAGLAVYKYLRSERLFEQVAEKGDILAAGLKQLAAKHAIIGDVRGRGLLLGLELVQNRERKLSFAKSVQASETVKAICMEEGLLLYTGVGASADVTARDYLVIAPPFIITKEETALLIDRLDTALTKAKIRFKD